MRKVNHRRVLSAILVYLLLPFSFALVPVPDFHHS